MAVFCFHGCVLFSWLCSVFIFRATCAGGDLFNSSHLKPGEDIVTLLKFLPGKIFVHTEAELL